LNTETSQLEQVILLTLILRFDFLSFEIIMVWYASPPQVIGQPLTPCQSYKLGGYLYGNDGKSYNAFVSFGLVLGTHSRLRIKIRANSAAMIPPSTGLTQGLRGRVKWRPEVQQCWGEYFDGAGNFKMNCKQMGANARLGCLEEWWLESFPDRRGDTVKHEKPAVESAFFKKGVTVNQAHVISASHDAKKRKLKSILESSRWTTKSIHISPTTP
jgi:hypothetical protein